MAKVDVAASMLKWARQKARLTEEELLKAFPKFYDWVNGEQKPTLKQLEKLAKRANVPLGYLFLDEPPAQEPLPIADYRTKADRGVFGHSSELIETINAMIQRQAWMREYLIEIGAEPLPFVASVEPGESHVSVAQRMRQTLGLQAGWAQATPSWNDAIRMLLDLCENKGILFSVNGVVENNTHRTLDPEEFRGFVLVDTYAPLIFINGADAKSAQMFTLAHELAHIWFGQSSLFDLPGLTTQGNEIERFCNAVAGEFLVPQAELVAHWERHRQRPFPFDDLARVFKVSPLAVARRAFDLQYIGPEVYWGFYNHRVAQEKKKPDEPGGNFYYTQRYRLGKPFTAAVVRAARSGRMMYRDAYRLLGLKPGTFDQTAEHLGI